MGRPLDLHRLYRKKEGVLIGDVAVQFYFAMEGNPVLVCLLARPMTTRITPTVPARIRADVAPNSGTADAIETSP